MTGKKMIIESVKKFNDRKTNKWHNDCAKWIPNEFGYGYPQLIMYIYEKNYGYVASENRCSIWRKTKKQVIADFKELYPEGAK
jgi:hypothetical protein